MSTAVNGTPMAKTSEQSGSPDLTQPPKVRRRPGMIAGAVVAICAGALLGGWAWTSTTSNHEVLAARNGIERGAVVTAGDLTRVSIGTDPALDPVSGSQMDDVVGKRAAVDIAAGALLTPSSTTSSVVPSSGKSVIGVPLDGGQLPSVDLRSGDRVRIVFTPGEDDATSGSPGIREAEVLEVGRDEQTGREVVTVVVPHKQAAAVAARVATSNVTLILDSRER